MKHIIKYPSQEIILEWFEYKDGNLYWKKRNGSHCRSKIGDLAGGKKGLNDYSQINFYRKRYYTHRLIWIYHNGNIPNLMEIDHLDKDKTNNKIENLRLTNRSNNCLNNNAKNIHFDARCKINPYSIRLRIKNKSYILGRFTTKEEAESNSTNLINKFFKDNDLEIIRNTYNATT